MEEKYLERLVETEQRSKSNSKRIDEHDKKLDDIYSLTIAVKEIATEMKAMREDLNKIDERVITIEDKPSKRMDLIWGYIVSAIVGAIITFIMVKLGLK